MADEFDERLLHDLPDPSAGCDYVCNGEEGEQEADGQDLQGLHDDILPPESGQTLVPDGRK